MSEVTLRHGKKYATIDTSGAWLTRLCDSDEAILYSQTYLQASDGSKKLRGGCHVCLPNFGPGGTSGLAQHGFGRTLEWDVDDESKSEVRLSLQNSHSVYADLKASLTYRLHDNGLTMTLLVENAGAENLSIAPAFHPYIALHDDTAPKLNGQLLQLADYGVAQYVEDMQQIVMTARRELTLTSTHLPLWAIWTDQLGPYVCVEPNHSGDSFDETATAGVPETLLAGRMQEYALSITW